MTQRNDWSGVGVAVFGFTLTGAFAYMAIQNRDGWVYSLVFAALGVFSLVGMVRVIEQGARDRHKAPVDIDRLNPHVPGSAEHERWREEVIQALTRNMAEERGAKLDKGT